MDVPSSSIWLLENRDGHFDFCKVFLLFTMFAIHTFQCFHSGLYHSNLTYCVTLGFIFLAGFTGAIRSSRYSIPSPRTRFGAAWIRAGKLVIIFTLCNVFVIGISSSRLAAFRLLDPAQVLESSVLLTQQGLFAFDILIPIAFVYILISILLTGCDTPAKKTAAIFLVGAGVVCSELFNLCNYYGVKLTSVGVMGALSAALFQELDWKKLTRAGPLRRGAFVLLSSFLALYFFLNHYYLGNKPVLVSLHLLPTVLLLVGVYSSSLLFRLPGHGAIGFLNRILGGQMLFAYLFHILLLNILFIAIPLQSLSGSHTLLLALCVSLLTLLACWTVAGCRERYISLNRLYRVLFK